MGTSQQAPTLTATCHCKAVQLCIPVPTEPLKECLCSICRRYGALWAYYDAAAVQMQGLESTQPYYWGDKTIGFYGCRHCNCVTHWAGAEAKADQPSGRIGVNCRMLERVDVDRLERGTSEGPP